MVATEARGTAADMSTWEGQPYRPVTAKNLSQREAVLIAVPCYAWANRSPGVMRVWIPL